MALPDIGHVSRWAELMSYYAYIQGEVARMHGMLTANALSAFQGHSPPYGEEMFEEISRALAVFADQARRI